MLEHVPEDIRACPQWLVWRKNWNKGRNKWDKQPIHARTGMLCDITSSNSWCDFDQACYALETFGRSNNLGGCGFVLGYNSNCVGIDFDDVFYSDGRLASSLRLDMADRFQSYTELSPSNTGLHVLARGHFEGGRRNDGVEVYGQGRFFTVTGHTYGAYRPFARRQTEIDAMVGEIDALRQKSKARPLDWNVEQKIDDNDLFHLARFAENGTKFVDLWEGRWHNYYPSQSEADMSLINMLGFYSEAPIQIARLFQRSVLGQRGKSSRLDYIGSMIARSQDRKVPLVEMPTIQPVFEQSDRLPGLPGSTIPPLPIIPPPPVTAIDPEDVEEDTARKDDVFQMSEGLVHTIADWLYNQSEYPMKELAVIGALGIIAGICGRQYQYNGSGLNLYIMLLARTGAGKDALSNGISKIWDAVASPPPNYDADPLGKPIGFPSARQFIGPSVLTGKGLLRALTNSSTLSLLSVIPEFSQTMSSMAQQNANEGMREFQRALLEFYTKSAYGQSYDGAMNADKAKDIERLSSPAFTMICEGTPERFYNALSPEMVSDGLLSRFIVVENDTYKLEANPYAFDHSTPTPAVVAGITELCQMVTQLRVNGDHRVNVQTTPEAAVYSNKIRLQYRKRGIEEKKDANTALWMRAHQNIVRIASLVAIGCNIHQPCVTLEQIKWADRIIFKQVLMIVGKFKRGETGQGQNDEQNQLTQVQDIIQQWISAPPSMLHKKGYAEAHAAGTIPYSYIYGRVSSTAAFRKDKRGSNSALRFVLDTLEKQGDITRVRLGESAGQYYKINL